DNDIILDFFSGSATTAHAVMQLNAGDGGHRKFIMIQLPEETDEKSEAFKAGYKNICEVGKERIRRASAKIKEEIKIAAPLEKAEKETGVAAAYIGKKEEEYGEEMAAKFDGGFRVLKLDSTNMKDVYYNPSDFQPTLLDTLADNIKEDRTPEDLLFQVMLDLGILLSSKITESEIGGKKVFNVEDNYLIACFDENVTDETITAIAKQKPYYFVMRDSSMASDSVATNFEQIFATYSPDTVRKVL
ncbi:MAG: site-specific DNA-methyltransferase, partial [Oscillospiraceae bacterium]|nr:site-specific DNA-methyltransferase [Oscillospiraceae bacterium]